MRVPDHSYEEIRGAALDILAGRERTAYPPTQYEHLRLGVGEVLQRRESGTIEQRESNLSRVDSELFLEVFWELFRQGVITLGLDDSNREFPFCRVSQFGKQILSSHNTYFFHDVSSYEQRIRSDVPQISEVTLTYLKEAMQAFRSGCILSSTVLLGVATEHTFLLLLEDIDKSKTWARDFASVSEQRTILQKVNKFKNILDQQAKRLSSDVREDLDTHFAGILSVIRNFRNQAGHPTGVIIEREQAFVLLQLFIPYCRKMYSLRAELRT